MALAFQENVKREICFVNDYRGAACWKLYVWRGLKYTGRPLLNDGVLHTKIRAKYKKLYPTPQICLLRHRELCVGKCCMNCLLQTQSHRYIYTYKFILIRIDYKTPRIVVVYLYLTYMV